MHSINMSREEIFTAAAEMGWDLAETSGARTGDVRAEAQDAANLLSNANPDAGLVFGYLADGSASLPWMYAVLGVRQPDGNVLARMVDVLELTNDRNAVGEDAFLAYTKVIVEHFNELVTASQP